MDPAASNDDPLRAPPRPPRATHPPVSATATATATATPHPPGASALGQRHLEGPRRHLGVTNIHPVHGLDGVVCLVGGGELHERETGSVLVTTRDTDLNNLAAVAEQVLDPFLRDALDEVAHVDGAAGVVTSTAKIAEYPQSTPNT